jgi:hypothetical protein
LIEMLYDFGFAADHLVKATLQPPIVSPNRIRELAAPAIWKATSRPWPTAFEPILTAPACQGDLV